MAEERRSDHMVKMEIFETEETWLEQRSKKATMKGKSISEAR